QTPVLSSFVVSEAVQNKDLNGDGDAIDDVVLLVDRETGQRQAIGDGGEDGLATIRIHEPPFSFPAVATAGDVVALLESEPAQGAGDLTSDINGDGDVADSILRVFRLGSPEAPLAVPRAVDALPVIDHRPLVISGGRVFVRSSEA